MARFAQMALYPIFDGTMLQTRGFFNFMTTLGSPNYVHMKTNINSNYPMWMIEAVGYNYSAASAVRCSWAFHKSGGGIYSVGLADGYPGLSANGAYISSDGYVVIRAYGGMYYCGFTLNAYYTRPDAAGTVNVSIIDVVQTSNSGNYY
jgi:hypothetical protein